MPKAKGSCKSFTEIGTVLWAFCISNLTIRFFCVSGKGGKNRRRGKGDGEESKRELEFKEDGKS
jgi:hypothetical protein